ncbi:MAG: tRNA (adenine-N1)-methyltransferase [Candidatus Helarchaeales archaeon]
MTKIIQEGDHVLLVSERNRQWLKKVEPKQFHTSNGAVNLEELIGKPYGTTIKSTMNLEFYAFEPVIYDYIMKSKRGSQIIYPKDSALIILFGGIGSGSKVIESGIGSAGLTMALANAVRPDGKIFAYEIREDFIKIARKNLERVGLDENVEIKKRDALQGFDEKDVDVIILDLATPWDVIPVAKKSLKPSGMLISYSPTINQVDKTVHALLSNNFKEVHTIEILVREWQVQKNRIRPLGRMIGHTGWITFARKLL